MKKLLLTALPLALLAWVAAPATAKIERLNLDQMVERTDNALDAEIVARSVFAVNHPTDGEMYFTKLTLAGRSMRDGRAMTVDVIYAGGFIDAENGVWNSEAPTDEDVRVGNKVVAFYRFVDNLGGGVAGNALYTSHGGIYRTQTGPMGRVVMGRGDGYAIPYNTKIESLDSAVRTISEKFGK